MRVLIVGATGFIGSAITAAVTRAGITVRGVVRDPENLANRFPNAEVFSLDLRDPLAHEPETWAAALKNVDAVVNAAGILQPRRERDSWSVHDAAPDALFAACEAAGIDRVIQISAVGVEDGGSGFARSKLAGDRKLMARDLAWTVLRPVIVVGDGSYGGTSMLRAIAAFPGITPVIGDGETALDFIHKDDLAQSIVHLLQENVATKTILEPASGEQLTLTQTVQAYRNWLGLGTVPVLKIPLWFVAVVARLGDLCKLDPITTTALAQFSTRLTGDAAGFAAATGVQVRGLGDILARRPAEAQDLWHARLYLARPVIRLTLAVLWLVSGVLGLFAESSTYATVLAPITQNPLLLSIAALATSAIDLAIAAALFAGWRLKLFTIIQFVMVLGYTAGLTLLAPQLWGDLFGGVLKNLPILALILVHGILERER